MKVPHGTQRRAASGATPAPDTRPTAWHPGNAVVVVSTVALILTAPGQTLLLSLLNVPLREAFGIDPFVLNTGYMVATITASLPLVWVGTATDRIGPRRMMILVALAFGGACLFMAAAAHIAMVFVGFFLLRFLGQGSLSLVSSHAVAMWFHERLGRMEGLRNVALFAASALLPALVHLLIGAFGWRKTWAGLGVFVAVTVAGLAWRYLHDRPEDLGLGLDGGSGAEPDDAPSRPEPTANLGEAMRTRAYVLLALTVSLPPMVVTAVIFDIEPLLAARGMGAGIAVAAVSVWSGTMALVAIPAGYLVDRVRPRVLLSVGTLTLAAGCVALAVAGSPVAAFSGMSLVGLGQSLVGPTVFATTARFFGRRHHGAIRSSLTRVAIIATGLGPFAFGASQRFAGGHTPAILLFAGLCIPIGIGSLWLAPPSRGSSRRPPVA